MSAAQRNALVTMVLLSGVVHASAAWASGEDVPKLAGQWTWTWKDRNGEEHRHYLEVEGAGTKLAARERFDDLDPVRVSDLKLEGKKLRFSVVRDKKRADYNGVVADSETINGTVTVTFEEQATEFEWKAKRQPTAKNPLPR